MGELKSSSFGTFVIRFKLENFITPEYSDADGKAKSYILNIEAWGQLAERVERSIGSGMYVLLEGSLVSRSYEDRSKNTHYRMVVKASRIEALGG